MNSGPCVRHLLPIQAKTNRACTGQAHKGADGSLRSASTVRTTGTTLPWPASRLKASKVAGCRSSIITTTRSDASQWPPSTAITAPLIKLPASEQRNSAAFSMSLMRPEAAEWNSQAQLILDRLRHQTFHSFSVFDWSRAIAFTRIP